MKIREFIGRLQFNFNEISATGDVDDPVRILEMATNETLLEIVDGHEQAPAAPKKRGGPRGPRKKKTPDASDVGSMAG